LALFICRYKSTVTKCPYKLFVVEKAKAVVELNCSISFAVQD